ncbi:hypothetical protein LGK97_19660 [Clostridium sp. CS001]|uniref:hypothetical protein n=1 Tax=Clostridium sp. CS001 TaxID=2880648 RepID=UPI001CF5A354|nr:hypothetical protein [Clostridium sp. CS001]MCB2291910.1 hypothetical protein [Clostridium sp. CS001]
MRKVNLNMEEIHKYSTIKRLIETDGNKKRAAIALNCSFRHINRMIKGFLLIYGICFYRVFDEDSPLLPFA